MAHEAKMFFVYIMASKPRGVLYTGLTSDLLLRTYQHREHLMSGFTKRYWVDRLVYFERHDTFESSEKREKLVKRWRRDWKIQLIEKSNPTWRDLYSDFAMQCGLDVA